MEMCVDHPDNMGVEVCPSCSRPICGLHDNSLCIIHDASQNSPPISLKVILITISLGFTFFMMYVFTSLVGTLSDLSDTQPGDVVTVDTEVVTVSEQIDSIDFLTIISVFLVVGLIFFVVIVFITYRLASSSTENSHGPNSVISDTSNRTFYCQNCGQELTMSDVNCTNCGKSTSDEKNLLK